MENCRNLLQSRKYSLLAQPRPKAVSICPPKAWSWYDPKVLETITTYLLGKETSGVSEPVFTKSVSIKELEAGQILRSDIETAAGALLLSAGQRLSLANINRLRNYAKMTGIKEPIQVEITISQN